MSMYYCVECFFLLIYMKAVVENNEFEAKVMSDGGVG